MTNSLNRLALIGLAIGGLFGMAGSFVHAESIRSALWMIDGIGLVLAASLLTLKYYQKRHQLVAAGFFVFAIGETVMFVGTLVGLEPPIFAAGATLWALALLLISIPEEFASWTRLVGVLTSILFIVTAARIFWGEPLSAVSSPLPFFAYPFFVVTFAGWGLTLAHER